MPLLTTRAGASSRAYGFGGAAGEELGGMVLLTPSSVSSTGFGNSSSIGANGSITFSSCATLQLNGLFSSSYDNYMVSIRCVGTAGNDSLNVRFASGGTTTTDSNYTYQYISFLSSTVTAGKFSSVSALRIGNLDSAQRGGDNVYIFGPYLSQPTVVRNTNVYGMDNAGLVDFASSHSTSSSYDGLWFQTGSGLFSGLISVYGLVGV